MAGRYTEHRRRIAKGFGRVVGARRFSFRPLSRYTIQEPIMAVILSLADSFARGVYAPHDRQSPVTFVHRYVIAFRCGATSSAIYCLTACSSGRSVERCASRAPVYLLRSPNDRRTSLSLSLSLPSCASFLQFHLHEDNHDRGDNAAAALAQSLRTRAA